ncbi:MAG: hypothetical protein ACT4PV_10015 [Planctomycetaceae bacterium]
MKRYTIALLVLSTLGTADETPQAPPAGKDRGEGVAVAVRRGDLSVSVDRKGTVLPRDAVELSLWPEGYRGEFLVLEVVAHGSLVKEGDVVLRLDDRAIREQLQRSEFDLRQARERMALQEADAAIQEQASRSGLERAARDAERAERRYQAFLAIEVPQTREREQLNDQSWVDRLDDQADELKELEKMYQADQLVDATEDIVLKRSRRSLDRTRASFELQKKARDFAREYEEAYRREDLEQDARAKAEALDRQRRSHEIAQARRSLDLSKAAADLEQQIAALTKLAADAARFEVRAPSAGILLHGAPDEAPWSARLSRGSRLTATKTFITIAVPGAFRAAADLAEADVARTGASCRAVVACGDARLPGTAEITPLALSRAGDGGNLHGVSVALDPGRAVMKPGMRCTITLTLAEVSAALLVPAEAVSDRGGDKVVRCGGGADGPFEERVVTLGATDGKQIAVFTGIREGEYVLVPGGGAK